MDWNVCGFRGRVCRIRDLIPGHVYRTCLQNPRAVFAEPQEHVYRTQEHVYRNTRVFTGPKNSESRTRGPSGPSPAACVGASLGVLIRPRPSWRMRARPGSQGRARPPAPAPWPLVAGRPGSPRGAGRRGESGRGRGCDAAARVAAFLGKTFGGNRQTLGGNRKSLCCASGRARPQAVWADSSGLLVSCAPDRNG